MSYMKGKGKAVTWLREHASYQGDDCLIWPFSLTNGYGTFSYLGETHYAHRFMCELIHGPAPSPEHEASHECGNGHCGCVHPKHVFWKTKSENQADRAKHGRKANGYQAKITLEQAAQIRALRGKHTQQELADMFGCSRANISLIQNTSARTKNRWPDGYVSRRARQEQVRANRFPQ